MNRKPRKEDFRELKSKKFPGGACPRTPLGACTIGARFGKSVISYRRSAPAAPVSWTVNHRFRFIPTNYHAWYKNVAGFNCLAVQGMMVSYGLISGPAEPVEISTLAKGSFSLCRPHLTHYIATDEDLKWRSSEVFDWIKEGKVKIGDFTVFLLSDGRKAYELMESGKSTGKILMRP